MRIALVILASGMMAAACSSGSGTPGVATLGGHAQGTTQSTLSSQQLATQSDTGFINFAHCLRSHGVAARDPYHRPGHTGLSIDIPTPNAHNRAALAACNHFIAKFVAAKEGDASRELASWLPGLTRYAACMRAHDIGMLDPGPQGQLSLGPVPGITDEFGRSSPQFLSADTACRHLLPAGVHDDGTGP